MRWLARIFANAVARRVAALIVAVAIAWFGIGRAGAQSFDKCYSDQQMGVGRGDIRCPDRGTAFAQAERLAIKLHTEPTVQRPPCIYQQNATVGWYYCLAYPNKVFPYEIGRGFLLADQCPAGKEWNDVRGACQSPCSSRPVETVSYKSIVLNGSVGCFDGCEAMLNSTGSGDGTYTKTFVGGSSSHCSALPNDCKSNGAGYSMNYGTSLCQPEPEECAANEVKDPVTGICNNGCERGQVMNASGVCEKEKDDCPAGNVKSPAGVCLPGDGQCSVGEAKGKDGTCKRDADGDGKPDAGEDEGDTQETFSGGDTCTSPPACSGSPILCGMARIQWRIDCNTRKTGNVSGGTCDAMPVCVGKDCDAMEYAQLVQQWKASCALQKLANKGDGEQGSDGTDANKNGVADALEGRVGTSETETPTVTKFGARFSTSVINEENIFGSGSCPEPPSFQLMGQSISGSDFPYWCKAMAILRGLILIFGAYMALKILMGWGF